MAVAITAAHGVKVAMFVSGSFTDIDGVHNGPNGPGFAPQMISARHHGSEDTFMKVSTVEKTPVTFDIYFDSSDSVHLALREAAKNATRSQFRITLQDTGGEVYTFHSYPAMTYSGQVDGFNVMSVSLAIDGGISVT